MYLPPVLRAIVLEYAAEWVLDEWVRVNLPNLRWDILAKNPRAGDLMARYPDRAMWSLASSNPSCWPYLRDHPSLINIRELCSNTDPGAIEFAIAHVTETSDECYLFENPAAIDWISAQPEEKCLDHISFLLKNPIAKDILDKFDIYELIPSPFHRTDDICSMCENHSQWAMERVFWYIAYANWHALSSNPFAIDILLAHQEKIDWPEFSRNCHPRAVALMLGRSRVTKMPGFSSNSCSEAIAHLRANPKLIDYNGLSANPGIFVLGNPDGMAESL